MAKRKKFIPKDCSGCRHSRYIGYGSFMCNKHIHHPERALVIEEWKPTSNFLQCIKGGTK